MKQIEWKVNRPAVLILIILLVVSSNSVVDQSCKEKQCSIKIEYIKLFDYKIILE